MSTATSAVENVAHAELSALRTEIDLLDEQLITLLAKRFQVTARIGKAKKALALPPVDTGREKSQFENFRVLTIRHGLAPTLISDLFRLVIAEVVVNHEKS